MKEKRAIQQKWCVDENLIFFSTKRELWEQMEAEIGVVMAYSTFCRKSVGLKKAKRGVDLCNLCERLKLLKMREKERGNLTRCEENEKQLLVEHRRQAEITRKAFHMDLDDMQPGDLVVLMDFKQDWALPISHRQCSREFYERQSITHLGVMVFVVEEMPGGEKRRRKFPFHFLSETLTKDIRFVDGCLRRSLDMCLSQLGPYQSNHMQSKPRLSIWTDTGTHFRNGYFIHSLFGDERTCLRHQFECTLSFFTEGHGKSFCDGEFGVLTNSLKKNDSSIKSIRELKQFFEVNCKQEGEKGKGWENYRSFHMFVFFSIASPFVFPLSRS